MLSEKIGYLLDQVYIPSSYYVNLNKGSFQSFKMLQINMINKMRVIFCLFVKLGLKETILTHLAQKLLVNLLSKNDERPIRTLFHQSLNSAFEK
jgi:hypothetical protein